jgi:glycosyltransferase involved in cell wall biosynthesis
MKSGATETAYVYLSEHYQFPDNVFVSHLPEEIKKSNHPYKILWAHHAYDQPVFVDFDHHTVNHIVSPSQWNKDQLVKYHSVPDHKISVISNGVADMFSYSDKKTKTMIYTSIPYKGLEVLAKIIPRIHQIHPDTKFKIFSSMSLYGPSNDIYLNLYDHLKTLPNVEYSQAVDQVELIPHYQDAAFFIHPNIWEETFCVSMVEAMKSGAYPIITDIGALAEVAGENNASIVPIDGTPTSKGYQVTENFINNFTETCCKALDYFDKEQSYYHEVSKIISDYVSEKYNWSSISKQWKTLIDTITGDTMTTENTALTYAPIDAQKAVVDDEYLRLAFDNVLRWEQSDKEMAQGRTNFQLEKFIGLNTHNISVSFEHVLKERRIMATGYMYKLIEMKEKVREFDYKWKDVADKTQPFIWELTGGGPGGGGKKLCWYDLDELELTHYLKSSELEIRDRLHQMEHLDKMLDKLIEQNGGKVPDREQFLEENENYWDVRLAEQALDDLMAAQTGISGANLQAMRRASGPSIVDQRNNLKEGYLPMNKLLDQQGRSEFINDLQSKVLKGYEKITGTDLGYGNASATIQPGKDKKQITGDYTEQ